MYNRVKPGKGHTIITNHGWLITTTKIILTMKVIYQTLCYNMGNIRQYPESYDLVFTLIHTYYLFYYKLVN